MEDIFMENKKLFSAKTAAVIVLGSAVMFTLMRFAAIPSGIPDTTFNPAPAVVSVLAVLFGPIAGFFIAFIGHTLTDLSWGSLWWSWIIADAFYGLLSGLSWKRYRVDEGIFDVRSFLLFNGVQIAANAIAWGGIAPVLDVIIYRESLDTPFLQGLVAGGLNSLVVLVLGSLLMFGYSKTRVKTRGLNMEQSADKKRHT
ncbi:MAG: ECF-type riboflavin transporter substrate-binding protein [Treponema sp.]|jgi:energy-coupling factor transport system substrate-specific component|nr:ECF-type riboflavin transporter substrate-binding protein [Treponema sp.]